MGKSDPLDDKFASRPGRRADDGVVEDVVVDDEEGIDDRAEVDVARRDRPRDIAQGMRGVVATDTFRWVGVAAVVVLVAAGLWLRRDGRPVDDLLPMASGGDATASSSAAAPGPGGDGGGEGSTTTPVAGPIVVHVAGQVVDPGVIELPEGARVADAIQAAGGPTVFADLDRLNLAAPLADGQRVEVAAPGDPPDRGGVSGSSGSADEQGADDPKTRIDLNRADAAELEELPGVGPATASAIVSHRSDHGPFGTVDELIDVRGIGPAKLEAIAERATVGP